MLADAAEPAATSASVTGVCSICGERGEFRFGSERSVRESYACPHCRFTLRWRDQASLILDEFGDGRALSLADLVRSGRLDALAIFEPALRGPFVRHFRALPKYTRSYFRPERRLGSVDEHGVRNEDLTKLTFGDDSFDLVITSDVMEHLHDIDAAFAEIHRVLKPGGLHIFSIPTQFPLPDATVARVAVADGAEIHLLPPVFHNAGDGTPCLVYHDFGADLPARIDRHGSRTRIVRRTATPEPCVRNATFVTRKLAAAAPRAPGPATRGTPTVACPVCGGTKFEPFNGRRDARCATCRAVERHRLMFMVIERLDLLRPGLRVFHVAPEIPLARRFEALLGDDYYPCDLDVSRYRSALKAVKTIDLCTDLESFPDASFDVIIHSHVLEHVACDVAAVLRQMERMLAPGGHHLFSVPVRGEHTVEDLSPLTDKERTERFGQADHMRLFGRGSLAALTAELWGEGHHFIDPLALLGEAELVRHAIPEAAWTSDINNHGIFYNRATELMRPAAPELDPVPPLAVATLTTGISARAVGTRRLETAAFILRNLAPAAAYPRLVDLGAGPGRFARLAAALGHRVAAVDGRTERLPADLGEVAFRHEDARTTELDGFDVVLALGLLYHLDAADQLALLTRCPAGAVVVIDTQIHLEGVPGIGDALGERMSALHRNVLGRYDGVFYREKTTAMASIGNPESFFPTEDSLLRMMADAGFRAATLVDPIYFTPVGARRWYVGRK